MEEELQKLIRDFEAIDFVLKLHEDRGGFSLCHKKGGVTLYGSFYTPSTLVYHLSRRHLKELSEIWK